ncbi:hypothetical protein EX30DRAFT_187453 [Ascodesmis nigricans]|uniref:Uncharacterized protein n=1 Tax=Ascodesmis nigricans TaxID=341454 RepID=A0A4S2N094_9PEZI|nr:hypothetical protein EX30DRAFT_187453 [Ascodesmis nigricans]
MANKPPPHTPVLQKPPNKPPRSPHRPVSHSNITLSPSGSPLGALGLINYVPGVSRDLFRTPSPNLSIPLSSELGTPSIRRTMTEPLPFPRRARRASGDSYEEMGNLPDGLDVRTLPAFPQSRPGWQSFEFMKNLDTGSKRKPKKNGSREDTMEVGEDPESPQQEQHASFNSDSRSSEDAEPDSTSKTMEQILPTPVPRRRHSSVIPTTAGKRLSKQYGYLNASPIVPSSGSKPMSSPSPFRSVPSQLQEKEAIDHYNSPEDPPTPTPKSGSSLKDAMLKPKTQQQPTFPPPCPRTMPDVPGASREVQGGLLHNLPSTQLPSTSATTTWAPVTTPYPRILCDPADFDPFKIAVHFTSTTPDGTKLSRPATKAEMETWEKTWKPKYQEFYRRLPEYMDKVDRANEAIEMVRLVMEVFEIASERKRKAVIEGTWDPEKAALRDKETRAAIMKDSRVATPMVLSTGPSGGGRKLANMSPAPRMRSGSMASGSQMGPPSTPPNPTPRSQGKDPRAAEAARLRAQIATMYQSRSQVFSGPSGFHQNQFQTPGSTQRQQQQQNQFNQPLRPGTHRPRSQSMLPPSTNPQQHFSPFAPPSSHPHRPQLGVFPPPALSPFSTRPIIPSNSRLDTQPSPRPVVPPKPPTTTTSNLSTATTIAIPDDNDDDNADQSDSDTDSEHEGDGTTMVDIDYYTAPQAAEGDETEDEPLPELELEPVPNMNDDEEKVEMEEWIKETFGDGGPGKHVMNLMLGVPDVEMDMGE